MNPRFRWPLLFFGLMMIALAVRIARIDDPARHIPEFLGHFAVFFAVYCAAIVILSRVETPSRWLIVFIFSVAVLCRLVFLGTEPSLSTDIYRYLWEGRVTAVGYNPFDIPPSAPELETLRDENFDGVSHKHMQTIYPPLAQGVFLAGAVIRPDITTQKILFVLFDLATLVLIFRLLVLRRRRVAMCAVYAWSPLVIIEFSHSGHVDSAGIFFLVLAAYLFERRSYFASTSALAFSFLAKYFALLLAPFFLFKKRYALWLIPFALIAVAGFLPFAGAGTELVSSLKTYSRYWEFNSAVFSVARRLFGHPDWVRIVLFGSIALFSVVQGIRRRDFLAYAFRVVAFSLVLAPTFYPWYLCWLVPFLCFFPKRSWIYLTGAVVLSYWVWVRYDSTGAWTPGPVVMAIEWVPFLGLLAVETVRSIRERGGEAV